MYEVFYLSFKISLTISGELHIGSEMVLGYFTFDFVFGWFKTMFFFKLKSLEGLKLFFCLNASKDYELIARENFKQFFREGR